MPTRTFFNLPEEKRERIVEAAVDEFATCSFQNASIAGIIERARIPRGSFYQYFADLKDLYKYILERCGERKIQYIYHVMRQLNELDVFQTIRELYAAGIRFAVDNPKMAAIGNNFFKENESLRREIIGEFEEKSRSFIYDLLKRGREKGEVDGKVDIKVASFLIFTLNYAIVDFFLAQSKHDNIFDDVDGFLALVDKMLYIIENGIKSKEGE